MATQQRSVIATAIVLAIILGGALVWLLNRTPANQLATQAPSDQEQPQATDDALLAQAQQPTATPETTSLSPTDSQAGAVQGVTATAPTGPADLALALAITSLGGGSLLALGLSRLKNFRS